MAVNLCLSPWPSKATQAETLALDYLKKACAGFTNDGDDSARALGLAASARVEREASGAPQAVKNQAVVRYCGYLAQADFGTIREESTGPRSVTYTINHARAWINCGAASILAPWKALNAAPVAHASEGV